MKTARETAEAFWYETPAGQPEEDFVDRLTAALEERDAEHDIEVQWGRVQLEADVALGALKVATDALEAVEHGGSYMSIKLRAVVVAALAHITKLVGMP